MIIPWEMREAIDKRLTYLRTAREAMQGGIDDDFPPLTENELFLLRLVEVKDKEIEMQKELGELLDMVRELDSKKWLKNKSGSKPDERS